jgi:phosphate transport system substrate-binding protein
MPSSRHALLLLALAALALPGVEGCAPTPTPHPRVHLVLGGASSMQPLITDLANGYHQLRPYATLEILGGNSATGLAELAQGSVNLAMVSRNPRADELSHPPARAVEVARDGIVIVVHSSNPLVNLSRDELARIFAGEILSWSELKVTLPPGAPGTIQVVSREDGSGTRSVFEQTVMLGRRVTLTALVQPSERDVLDYIAANPNAIGYAAFNIWNIQPTTRAVSIDDVAPTLASIQASKYPLMRTFYLVAPIAPSPDVSDFLDFILSDSGRQIVRTRMATP